VRATRTGVVLLAAALIAVGCGSSSSDLGGVTTGQRRALVAQLEAVRGAAAAQNVAGATAALDRFRAAVAHLRRTGALTDQQARALRIGAARVLARVKTDNPPTPPPTTATQPAPAPTPGPAPPGQAKKEKKPKTDRGKGHGEGDD
jgi:outer membrane biosynthesis protein TonB